MADMRPAAESDRPWLFDLHRAAFRERVELVYGPWDEAWQRAAWARRDPRNEVMIIEIGSRRAGAIHTRLHDDGSLYVDLIEVHPLHQLQGLGTRLLEAAVKEGAEQGRDVSLQVHKGNPAERLYLRMGFAVEGETDTHLLMRRRVASPGSQA